MKTIEQMKKDGLEPWEVLNVTRNRFNHKREYLTDDELWYYATLPDDVLIDKIKKVYFNNREIEKVPRRVVEAVEKSCYLIDVDFWQLFEDWEKSKSICSYDEPVLDWIEKDGDLEKLFLFLLDNSEYL